MKLISLNTWGGRHFNPICAFIKKHEKDTDIFCFQEIYDTSSKVKQYKNLLRANLLLEIKTILPNFNSYFLPSLLGFDNEGDKGNIDLKFGNR